VTADVTSRSIKEVWLEARSASEQAPSPVGFGSDGPRRRVLSTIKRRVADTLAGETMSTLISQHRVPTRILGWSAAAAGLGAILWSLLVQGTSPPRPVAHAAAQPAPVATEVAPPPPSAGPPSPPAPTPTAVPPVAPAAAASRVAPRPAVVPEKKAFIATRPATTAARPSRAAASPANSKTTHQPTHKRIDQEFGF
jgi:hypothetical protein